MIGRLRAFYVALFVVIVGFATDLYFRDGVAHVLHFYALLVCLVLIAIPLVDDSKRLYGSYLEMEALNRVRVTGLNESDFREVNWLSLSHRGLSSLYRMLEVFSRFTGLRYRLFCGVVEGGDSYCYRIESGEVRLYISESVYSSMTARDMALSLGLSSCIQTVYQKVTDGGHLESGAALLAAYLVIVPKSYALIDGYGGDHKEYDLKNVRDYLRIGE
ncbi:hypothetical protein AB4571_02635 [Vibrio breoganii]|uniref:hypothetical protein n=1 Tax=Vibrio breoganii TaxID=553239 RepID=UPI000C83BF57|nr:hypothetical protein [Vibrio breoganii]PML12808.1 hypothetical protein BCT84_02680 [Vibrio breoganii]